MATTYALSTVAAISVRANNVATTDLSTITDPLNLAKALSLAAGTGSGKADTVYHKKHTIAAGVSDVTINFEDGSMDDVYGVPVEIDQLKLLLIHNPPTDSTLEIGGAQAGEELPIFADPLSDIVIIQGGGTFVWLGGLVGLDITSNGELKLNRVGGSAGADIEIVAIGGSAA